MKLASKELGELWAQTANQWSETSSQWKDTQKVKFINEHWQPIASKVRQIIKQVGSIESELTTLENEFRND